MRRPVTYLTLLFLGLTPMSLLAGDGAIEIWEPTTITEAGSYVVTRNITGTGQVITIDAENVHLDLNGFTVENTNTYSGQYTIYVGSAAAGVTIDNGTVVGGDIGIRIDNAADHVTVRRVTIRDSGRGLYTGFGRGYLIEDNVILDCGTGAVLDGYGTVFRTNLVQGSSSAGVLVWKTWNRIENNAVIESGGDGMHLVSGAGYNQLIGNHLFANGGYGLTLHGGFNVYRENVSRNNAGSGCGANPDFCLNGPNTSADDNYMPTKM